MGSVRLPDGMWLGGIGRGRWGARVEGMECGGWGMGCRGGESHVRQAISGMTHIFHCYIDCLSFTKKLDPIKGNFISSRRTKACPKEGTRRTNRPTTRLLKPIMPLCMPRWYHHKAESRVGNEIKRYAGSIHITSTMQNMPCKSQDTCPTLALTLPLDTSTFNARHIFFVESRRHTMRPPNIEREHWPKTTRTHTHTHRCNGVTASCGETKSTSHCTSLQNL